jgi:hypothetical protein
MGLEVDATPDYQKLIKGHRPPDNQLFNKVLFKTLTFCLIAPVGPPMPLIPIAASRITGPPLFTFPNPSKPAILRSPAREFDTVLLITVSHP